MLRKTNFMTGRLAAGFLAVILALTSVDVPAVAAETEAFIQDVSENEVGIDVSADSLGEETENTYLECSESDDPSEQGIVLSYVDTEEDKNAPSHIQGLYEDENSYNATIDLPEKYNTTLAELKAQNYPNTRSQSPWGTCWAHAAVATAEISMIKQGYADSSVNYSEFALAYFFYNTVTDPLGGTLGDRTEVGRDRNDVQKGIPYGNTTGTVNYLERGGNNVYTWRALATWMGVSNEEGVLSYPYTDTLPDAPDDSYAYRDEAVLKDVRIFNSTERDAIKEAIYTNGAVSGSIYWSESYYDNEHNSYYTSTESSNHAITLVGWDDTFPASNFSTDPGADGAWLLRNSWTTKNSMSKYGYLWISYEDASLNAHNFYEQIFVPAGTYEHNYQYDGGVDVTSASGTEKFANIFKVSGEADSELLRAVSFSASHSADVPYKVCIYTDVTNNDPESGELAATVSGATTYPGYYTIDLPSVVKLDHGSLYSVVVEVNDSSKSIDIEYNLNYQDGYPGAWLRAYASSRPGESFLYRYGQWEDYNKRGGKNVCIKAFTDNMEGTLTGYYKVRFNGNGSTSGSMADQLMKLSESVKLLSNGYKKEGYYFDGWNTAPDGSGISYADEEAVTDLGAAGETVELYAQWKDLEYSILFDGNGETSGETPQMLNLKSSDGKITLPECGFKKGGYSFLYWSLTKDGKGTRYYGGDTIDCPADPEHTEITFYAIWRENDYYISFYAYPGSLPDGMSSFKAIKYGEKIGELPIPTHPKGYTFWGWYTEYSGGTLVTEDTVFTPESRTTVVYACWHAGAVKVTLDPGEGSVSENEITVYRLSRYGYRYNKENILEFQEIPDAIPDTTEDGKHFIGWYTDKEYGTQITANSYVSETTEDHTLYARYEEPRRPQYTIQYVSYAYVQGYMPSQAAYVSKNVTLIPNRFMRPGYYFAGWCLSPDGEGTIYEDGATIPALSNEEGNVYLYAQWKNVEVTVSFDGNGADSGNVDDITLLSSDKTHVYPEGKFTKKGYKFVGWSLEKDDRDNIIYPGETILVDADPDKTEITYYAVWDKAKYKIYFDPNYPSSGRYIDTVTFGEKINWFPNVSREGYELLGWFTAIDGGVEITEDTVVTEEGDIDVYAHWHTGKVLVTLDAGEGSVSGGDFYAYGSHTYGYRYEDGEIVNKELPVATPKSDEYGNHFTGWYTDPAGGTEVTSETLVEMTEDHTLYAHYEIKYIVSDVKTNIPASEDDTVSVMIGTSIVLSTETEGATIYTAVGVDISNNEYKEYSEPIILTESLMDEDRNIFISAYAAKEGYKTSNTSVYKYKLNNEVIDWGDSDTIEEDARSEGYNNPTELPEGLWLAGIDDEADYDGSAHTWDFRVYDNKTRLVKNRDYKVTYKNNKNAGTASVVVSGTGNYKGSIVKTVRINPCTISDERVKISVPDIKRTNAKGKSFAPVKVVGLNGTLLKSGTDYTVIYRYAEDEVPVKNGKKTLIRYYGDTVNKNDIPLEDTRILAEIIGKGNYCDSVSSDYALYKDNAALKDISKISATVDKFEYSGSEISVDEIGDYIKLSDKGRILSLYEDYEILDFEPFENAGSRNIVVVGLGEYTGYKTVKFTVSPRKLYSSNFEFKDSLASVYYSKNGAAPEFKVFDGGELILGKDYTVTYKNNKKVSKATGKKAPSLTIKGIGNYSGSFTVKYEIIQRPIEVGEIIVKDVPVSVDADGWKSPVTVFDDEGNKLGSKDYSLSYMVDDDFTGEIGDSISVIVTGKGNYTGEKYGDYEIVPFVPKDISKLSMNASDVVYSKKAGKYKSTPVIKDEEGNILKNKKDYINIAYYYDEETTLANGELRSRDEAVGKKDIPLAGTKIRIEVNGIGDYTGLASCTYRIAQKSISKATVKVSKQVYNGKEICPGYGEITVKVGKTTLTEEDFDIVSYSNNIKKGTAKILIKGKGIYAGTKTVSFKITERSMSYTIIFNGNGATGGKMKNKTVAYEKSLKLPKVSYKKKGYVLDDPCWNTEPDGSGTYYSKGDIIDNYTHNGETLILYAQWIKK